MDVTRTEEQAELASMVRQLLTKLASPEAVRAVLDSESGYDARLWSTLCEQVGVAALAVPEQYDGAGFSLAEGFVVLEELGRSLAPTPLLGALVATEALLASGNADVCAALLPRIAAGEVAAVSFDGRDVEFGDTAAVLLAFTDEGLVVVDDGTRTRTPAMDPGLSLATIEPTSTTVITADADEARARAHRVAVTGAACLGVGVMQRGLDDTVAYSRERVQFGRPIGSFQALKHRMADMLVLVETSRSASYAAANAVAAHDAEADHLTAVAGSYCGDAVTRVAGEVVQLHGGIAITWEHDAHLLFKRAYALATLFGQPHEHRARLAEPAQS